MFSCFLVGAISSSQLDSQPTAPVKSQVGSRKQIVCDPFILEIIGNKDSKETFVHGNGSKTPVRYPRGRDGPTENLMMDAIKDSKFVLTYEDKDGDWMLVGDVPWDMFTNSCRKLRISKGPDATGNAPRATEKKSQV